MWRPLPLRLYLIISCAVLKIKSMALILCVVLGMLGAHCFYAGKAGMGILYLFTGGLFGIGWIVDIIRIAAGSYTDSHGLPIK